MKTLLLVYLVARGSPHGSSCSWQAGFWSSPDSGSQRRTLWCFELCSLVQDGLHKGGKRKHPALHPQGVWISRLVCLVSLLVLKIFTVLWSHRIASKVNVPPCRVCGLWFCRKDNCHPPKKYDWILWQWCYFFTDIANILLISNTQHLTELPDLLWVLHLNTVYIFTELFTFNPEERIWSLNNKKVIK